MDISKVLIKVKKLFIYVETPMSEFVIQFYGQMGENSVFGVEEFALKIILVLSRLAASPENSITYFIGMCLNFSDFSGFGLINLKKEIGAFYILVNFLCHFEKAESRSLTLTKEVTKTYPPKTTKNLT